MRTKLNPNTISISKEIESLADSLRLFAGHHQSNSSFRSMVEGVTNELSIAARQGESYDAAQNVIRLHRELLDLFGSALSEMATDLERLEHARLRRQRYSTEWWDETVQKLREAFDKDPETAFRQWRTIYAEALVDWELETCVRLTNIDFLRSSAQFPYVLLIRHGQAALQKKDYNPALKMLHHLAGGLSESMTEGERLSSALLSIFIGRIHLYEMEQVDTAREAFDRAASMAPHDGRPLAAQGHAALAEGEKGWAEANRLFSRAIEFSPAEPEGYVGKAMLAEARLQWGEADEWYKTAVKESLDEPDPLQFLGKLLAPGSGRLYLQVASHFLDENETDRAMSAAERGLEIGMTDGTNYPQRRALALKADILLSASGADRSPEETKIIADLYAEAGKYYLWTDEYQTAVVLLRKARALDGRNAPVLFDLADSLRILSNSSTPPYYSSVDIVRESQEAWEAGEALGEPVTQDNAWIYVARARIAKQVARLPGEDENDNYWQAIVHDEQALLFNEVRTWWIDLAESYNGLSLYANMFHVLQKAENNASDDLFVLEEKAKVLINTCQLEAAQLIMNKLLHHEKAVAQDMPVYQSWQATLDYYQGNYEQALENLTPVLESTPDDMWAVELRAYIRLAMGDHVQGMADERWIWDQRTQSKYKSYGIIFARASFLQGMFSEAIDRFKLLLDSSDPGQRIDAQFYSGLSYIALGDFDSAGNYLAEALQTSDRRRMMDFIMELDLLQKRALREKWPLAGSIAAYVEKKEGVLNNARSKQKDLKPFEDDPIKELKSVLSNRITGQPGSWSWLAAQIGLGRLYMEAGRNDGAAQAYQELSRYPQHVPECAAALKKVNAQRV